MKYEAVAMELSLRAGKDQKMRRSNNWDASVDHDNTNWLKELVGRIGWPRISEVSLAGSHNAWLLAQHADHDPEFQTECLALMKSAPYGEVPKDDIAYLEDRVRVNTGRVQLYGTQFTETDGKFVPQPIEDPENVDKRRCEMNLGPLEDSIWEMHSLIQ